jgi:hypothetical protein
LAEPEVRRLSRESPNLCRKDRSSAGRRGERESLRGAGGARRVETMIRRGEERRREEKREDNGSASVDLQETGISAPASHTAGDKVALILDHESAHE